MIETSTSAVNIEKRDTSANETSATTAAEITAGRRPMRSVTRNTLKPSEAAMINAERVDGVPDSLRSSAGMAGPCPGRKYAMPIV